MILNIISDILKPHIEKYHSSPRHMGTLSSLEWLNRFLDETPGDLEEGGPPRQVPNACWSRVKPTPSPEPN